MIDNKRKLDFMVKILTRIKDSPSIGLGYCTFNYFGIKYFADFDKYLTGENNGELLAKVHKVLNVMNQIIRDKSNYTKYLDVPTERYLLKVYNDAFHTMVIKYTITYTKDTVPDCFRAPIERLLLEYDTFYVLGDYLGKRLDNALIATDNLERHALIFPSEIKQLINIADDYTVGQIRLNEALDFMNL